jgi:hypothetical protein
MKNPGKVSAILSWLRLSLFSSDSTEFLDTNFKQAMNTSSKILNYCKTKSKTYSRSQSSAFIFSA